MRLDDPELVRLEYASEERLALRAAIWREWVEGPRPEDVAFAAIAEVAPESVFEVGCGPGGFAARVASELGAHVVAVDLSPRMVELARSRGVDARLGDVLELELPDGGFDCAVANWVLYHVPDIDRALAELVRVLKRGGYLIAATFAECNLPELWEFLCDPVRRVLAFSRENGADVLRRHFASVETQPVDTTVVFPDRDSVLRYVAATVTRHDRADRVPRFDGPLRASGSYAVFVARTAR